MPFFFPTLCLLLPLLLPAPLSAQQPKAKLLGDLNLNPVGSPKGFQAPRVLGRLGNRLILSFWSNQSGEELWVTQGTPSTTTLLKDIIPGRADSSPRLVGILGKKIFFFAETSGKGRELWVTDGTTAGTKFFMELVGGKGGAELKGKIQSLVIGNKLFFLFHQNSQNAPLWVTDGTPQGTHFLNGFSRLPATSSSSYDFQEVGGKLFLSSAGGNRTAWSSDGTLSGTNPLFPIRSLVLQDPSNQGQGAAPMGKDLFFFGFNRSSGWDLYSTDGTPKGSRFRLEMGKGFVPGPMFQAPGHLLWVTPGAKNRLVSVDKTLKPVVLMQWDRSKTFQGFLTFQSKAYIFFTQGVGRALAYATDGTKVGTKLAIPLTFHLMNPLWAFPLGKKILFYQGPSLRWLTVWDSVAQTFTKLPTEEPGFPFFRDGLRVVYPTPKHAKLKNGDLSFLWQSDGTGLGTHVLPLGRGYLPTLGSNGVLILPWSQGRTRIVTASAPDGSGLFEVQGAGKSIQKLGDPTGLLPVAEPKVLRTDFGKTIFHQSSHYFRTTPLWVTDGTPSGTKPLGTLGVSERQTERYLARLQRRFILALNQPIRGLWSSDGTAAGSRFLYGKPSKINPDWEYDLTRIGNRVFFFGEETKNGKGLFYPYVTDGTPQGNARLPFGPYSSFTRHGLGGFAKWRNWALFPFADRSEVRLEGYDPNTKIGKTLLKQALVPIKAMLTMGDELLLLRVINFKSQKLEALRMVQGKVQIRQVQTFKEFDEPQLFRVQDRVFAWVPPNKRHFAFEIWGNQGGTSPLKRLFQLPSNLSLDLRRTTPVFLGSRKVVLQPSNYNVRELWMVDLIAKTSTPLGYKTLTTGIPRAYGFQLSAGNLFFFAQDQAHGVEPWVVSLGASGRPVGIGCSSAAIRTSELEVEDPVLGTRIQIRGQEAPQGGSALLVLGLPLSPSLTLPGQTCPLHFNPLLPWVSVAAFAVPKAPVWRQKVNIPNSTRLLGLTAVWQAIYPRSGGAFETSNGYETTFGR